MANIDKYSHLLLESFNSGFGMIRQVHEQYGILTGVQLSRLMHAPGTPWHEVWYGPGRNSTIPNHLIQKHYQDMAA